MRWTEIARREHDRCRLRYASDCTDEEWAVVRPLMRRTSKVGRPRKHKARTLSPGGIRAFGTLRYAGARNVIGLLDDLVPLEGRRQRRDQPTATVSYRYNPLDISKIHVWNRVRKRYVTLHCTDELYADGMPLGFHEELRVHKALGALAQDVVANLDSHVDAAEQALVINRAVADLDIDEIVWRARWHLGRLSRADAEIADELLERALAAKPNSVEVLIQSALAKGWSIWSKRGTETEIAEMRALALRAIAADGFDARG